jgi:hypothetical protein
MIRCPNCGTKNKKNAKFCATCGKSLENANRIVKKNQPKKGNEALMIILVVCLLLGGGYFAYTRYATSNSKGTLFNELGLGQKKDSQKKQDSKAKLAKAKSENESLKKEKKSDQDSSSASSSSNEASSNSKTVSSVTQPHNDPQLKEDGNAGLEDIQGHWNLVKRVNDPDEGMPTDFDWNDDHLTENFSDGSQGEMTADTIRWSDIDQVYYLSDDSGQQFTFNLEEKSINGERRVLLKSINQGMTAWYERN